MKKLLLLSAILFALTSCTKINKDQPCGTTKVGTITVQLFKDSNGNCYYVDDSNGNHVSVATCGC